MNQNWFYRGNALIHSLSEQETTSHSVAVWRIGQCGVFLKYNGKNQEMMETLNQIVLLVKEVYLINISKRTTIV